MILQPRSRPSLILASAWLQVLPSVNNPSGVLQTKTSRPPTLNARMPFKGMSSAGATRYQLSLMSILWWWHAANVRPSGQSRSAVFATLPYLSSAPSRAGR